MPGAESTPAPSSAPTTSSPESEGAGDLPLAGNGEPVDGQSEGSDPGEAAAPTLSEQAIAPLPTVRQEHAVVALGTEIVVIGGFTPAATSSVAAYDPASDSWRPLAAFPSVLHHANAAVVADRLFVAGFYVGTSFTNASGAVHEYDPAQDAWVERTAMPAGTERASGCVASFEGKVYVFGGARGGTVADASAYDAASDQWEVLPSLPEPREHCAAGAIGDEIIIASGRAEGIGGFQPNTWAYLPAEARYELRAPPLTARGGTAGAVLEGRLYIFGGEGNASDPSGVFPQVEAYDPGTDTWQAFPDMLFPRHGLGAGADEGRIYLPGGASQQGFGAEDTHTVYIP
jgi:N-acetylneuraminic acid mutarotase